MQLFRPSNHLPRWPSGIARYHNCVRSCTDPTSNLGGGGILFFEHVRVRFFRTCSGFGYVFFEHVRVSGTFLRGIFRFRVSVGVSKKKSTFDRVYLLLTA